MSFPVQRAYSTVLCFLFRFDLIYDVIGVGVDHEYVQPILAPILLRIAKLSGIGPYLVSLFSVPWHVGDNLQKGPQSLKIFK